MPAADTPPIADTPPPAPEPRWSDHLPDGHGMSPEDVSTYDALMHNVHGPAPRLIDNPDLLAFGDPFPQGAFKGQAGEALRAQGFAPPSASDAAPIPTADPDAEARAALTAAKAATQEPAQAAAPAAPTISGSWGTPPGAGGGKPVPQSPIDVTEQYRTNEEELRLAKAAQAARQAGAGEQAAAAEKYVHDLAEMQAAHEHDRALDEKQILDAQERAQAALSGKLDANNLWAHKDTGERIGTIMGLGLGQAAQIYGKLPTNLAADMVRDQIHNDIDIQKYNKDNEVKGAQLGVSNLEKHIARGADDLKSLQLALRDGYDQAIIQAKMTAEANGADPSEVIAALKDRQALDEHVLQAEIATKRLATGKHPVNVGIVGVSGAGPETSGTGVVAPAASETHNMGPSPEDIAAGNVSPTSPEGIDYLRKALSAKEGSPLKPEFGGVAPAAPGHAVPHAAPAPHAASAPTQAPAQSAQPPPPPVPAAPPATSEAAPAEHWIVDDAGRTGKTHEEQMAHVDAHNQGLVVTAVKPRSGGMLPYDQFQPDKRANATIVRVAPNAMVQKQVERTIPLYEEAANAAHDLDRQLASKDLYSAALSFQSMKLKWLAAVGGGAGRPPGLGMLKRFEDTFDPDHLLDSQDPTHLKKWVERTVERQVDKGGITTMRTNLRNIYKEIQEGHRSELSLAPEKAYLTDERGRVIWLKK